MSFKKIQWALSIKIKPIPSRVLIQLASHHNDETGVCCPSLTSLQESCQLSRQGVVNSLKYLEEHKLITRTIGKWGSNQYKLLSTQSSKLTSQGSRLVKEVDQGSQVNGLEVVKEVDQGSQGSRLKTVIKTRKETGKETGVPNGNEYTNEFEQFWKKAQEIYKTVGSSIGNKKEAYTEWSKLDPELVLIANMISSLNKQHVVKKMFRDSGKDPIPFKHMVRWIRNRCWEDEPEPPPFNPAGNTNINRSRLKAFE